jgi:hypothetical protein
MNDPSDLADKYVALWNEPSPERRSRLIRELWIEDGEQLLSPPQEIREIANRPAIGLEAVLEARGYSALESRAASAYGEWIERGRFRFRRRDDLMRISDVVTFTWEMVAPDGAVAGTGLEFLVLAADGPIVRDYQFVA